MPANKTSKGKKSEPTIKDILKELRLAGKSVQMNLKKAWKSKQKEATEKQIAQGIETFIKSIDRIVESAKSKDLEKKIKYGLHANLKKLNLKLKKTSKKWKQGKR